MARDHNAGGSGTARCADGRTTAVGTVSKAGRAPDGLRGDVQPVAALATVRRRRGRDIHSRISYGHFGLLRLSWARRCICEVLSERRGDLSGSTRKGNDGRGTARTARAANRYARPTAAAPHLDSTQTRHGAFRPAGVGRVGVWRGDVRLSMSVSAPFVWRCLSGSAVAPFPHPAHRTGHADFPHPALGQDLTPSFACDAIGSF